MTTYKSTAAREDYAPPLTGNGDISLGIDGEGGMSPDSFIWWAGRRWGNSHSKPLVPFGRFFTELTLNGRPVGAPAEWSETLDPREALITTETGYAGGLLVSTTAFAHAEYNLITVRKTFSGLSAASGISGVLGFDNGGGRLGAAFRYQLTGPGLNGGVPGRLLFTRETANGRIIINYKLDGQRFYRGRITIFADRPLECSVCENSFALDGEFTDETVTYYILFCDDTFGGDPASDSERIVAETLRGGFDGTLASHTAAWKRYFDEGSVTLPDKELEECYYTAAYHLRCATTRWSIPINICDTHWHGRYFAFDEYFSMRGLLTSGHLELARRVPEFRFAGLKSAVSRASSHNVAEARYPWETLEDGSEGAPYGFWMEHIFHMANVARGAWEYFLYTGDAAFLREKGWPMIRACSEFFYRHMLYRGYNGRTIIGRCTDLERLGSSVENAFMTTCSVITTFRALGEAAETLGLADGFTADCLAAADELKRDLPVEDGMYVPHPGCAQKSIAMFSGTFPYFVLDPSDEKQRRATEAFCENESKYGNMYALGKGVSSWYALWKALTYARWGEPERAYGAVKQAVAVAGCFGEMYEINEPGHRVKPWFTTSSGILLNGVNELLLQSEGGELKIAPGVPESWKSFSFTLPAAGGLTVRCEVRDAKLCALEITGPGADMAKVSIPGWVER